MLQAYSGRFLPILPNFTIETSTRETVGPSIPNTLPIKPDCIGWPRGPGPSLATDFRASYSGPS